MKNEITKKIQGITYDFQCRDENCGETFIKITIYSLDGSEDSFELECQELPRIISDLQNMNNINQMKNYSENLKQLQINSEVDNILNGWKNISEK